MTDKPEDNSSEHDDSTALPNPDAVAVEYAWARERSRNINRNPAEDYHILP